MIDIALSRDITERDIRMACVHALILDLNLVSLNDSKFCFIIISVNILQIFYRQILDNVEKGLNIQ